MNTLKVEMRPLVNTVDFSDSELIVRLLDGRTISAPIVWFPKLANASQSQLASWEVLGDGEGIHWPDLDEDLSVKGLLLGSH